MRPASRIAPLLARLRRAWEACPDMRLGQLAVNASQSQVYSIEDEALVAAIEAACPAPACAVGDIWRHPIRGTEHKVLKIEGSSYLVRNIATRKTHYVHQSRFPSAGCELVQYNAPRVVSSAPPTNDARKGPAR